MNMVNSKTQICITIDSFPTNTILRQYKNLFKYAIGLMSRVFANGPEDRGSIPGQVIPKTQKMVLAALLNALHYKVKIEGKVEQSME